MTSNEAEKIWKLIDALEDDVFMLTKDYTQDMLLEHFVTIRKELGPIMDREDGEHNVSG